MVPQRHTLPPREPTDCSPKQAPNLAGVPATVRRPPPNLECHLDVAVLARGGGKKCQVALAGVMCDEAGWRVFGVYLDRVGWKHELSIVELFVR
jgi:hypothetical protein